MSNFGETLSGRGAFCLWHLGFSLPMITLLHSNQSASSKMRLARVAEDDCPQALMTVPGVGPITALAFAATIDDPTRFKRSRDIGPYLGLVPKRHQSGEVDYTGSISKRGDVRVRTLLYEAANVMLTRYAAPLKLKSWALAIGARSTMRKARVALARRRAIILHAMMRDQTDFQIA